MKKLYIYDDEKGTGERYAERLKKLDSVRKSFDVDCISSKRLENDLGKLKERQRRIELGQNWHDKTLLLDEASVFIIDFNIWKAFRSETYLTGEEVAYHARCFSKCGMIIGLNQFSGPTDNVFDLTLKGRAESYADLNITSAQLDNPGLWSEQCEEFRPWYWPQIPRWIESFEMKARQVSDNMGEAICSWLGLQSLVNNMSKSARAFLGGTPGEVTFAQFVKSSGSGLRLKDRNNDRELTSRIAAARVSTWMNCLVLPGQDLLVDAPHLVSRYPSLLNGDHSKEKIWNDTARLCEFDKLGLHHERIEKFRFKNIEWLFRPAWFWGKLSESRRIREVKEPWEREAIAMLFCEDSSRFHKREECTEFIADLDSPYTRRFVRHFSNVEYQPKANLM